MRHYFKYEGLTFPADKIKAGNIYLATSLLASSLEVSSFYVEVEHGDPSILNFSRNAKLLYYAEPGWPMVFRVQSITRVGPKLYRISATSTLGLLTEGLHYGGIYTGETAEEVIASICGAVAFEIKSNLKKVRLYGWLPIAAPRDNLAQVLFAIGATLKTDLDGVLRIEGLWDGISGSVGADQMYLESSVSYAAAITAVAVTEHQYVKSAETKNLFEGTAQQGDIITFSEPMHSLASSGFTILDHGANWAKLSAGSGILTGNTYVHNTREVTRSVANAQEPNVKSVKDATLVSMVNSSAAANRLANFYRWRETVDAHVVYRGERPGDRLATFHPFDRVDVAACLESVDISLSNTLKAQEKSLVGFVPEKIEEFDYYDTREVILTDREWIVPDEVESLRVVLIGGGQGGYSGRGGASGKAGSSDASGGSGGAGGAGGSGGNILQASLEVTPGTRYEIRIGRGGAGGQYSSSGSVAGSAGGDSTFGDCSSASGSPSDGGFVDLTTEEAYATKGSPGVAGGNGGKGGTGAGSGYANAGARVVYNGASYNGGFGGGSSSYPTDSGGFGGGGGGGGAAAGGQGVRGEDGWIATEKNNAGSYTYVGAWGGAGGRGGSAATPPAVTIRGAGGNGGNGGGGGGGGGKAAGAKGTSSMGQGAGTNNPGAAGAGGIGSNGGAGAPGCVILYYGVKKKKQSGQLVDQGGKVVLDKTGRRIIV